MSKTCLIVEGGGFKTGFTAGLLDALLMSNYNNFDMVIGISGGAIAASYFLSNQYRQCVSAMKLLAKDEQFTKFTRTFGDPGYMDIDYLKSIANKKVPLDMEAAVAASLKSEVYFVATEHQTGSPHYLKPIKDNWIDILIASSTLPFVTKGIHKINNIKYFDGGWGDPLPVRWAYEQGATNILVLRTFPEKHRNTLSLADYFGSVYYKSIPELQDAFANYHTKYNRSVDFIMNPPKGLNIEQITPIKTLKSTTYTYSNKTIMSDYRYGLDKGLYFVAKKRK